jgi:sugar-specific transcriptional regulator TrmB
MDTTILEDLGLTQAEIKVYLALLELGSGGAGDVLSHCRLQNSVMHRALNSLIEKGLINYILEGRRKIYQATKPENFYNYIDDKKKRFEQVLPELKAKQEFSKAKEQATIYKGTRGIDEVYRQLREEKGKEYLSFGGGAQCLERMGDAWWTNHHLKRIEIGLLSRQVFDETVKGFGVKLIKKSISKVRYLPADFAQFQETVIVGNLVAITMFTEHAYSVLIRDPLVAAGYKKHFEVLWKSAEK